MGTLTDTWVNAQMNKKGTNYHRDVSIVVHHLPQVSANEMQAIPSATYLLNSLFRAIGSGDRQSQMTIIGAFNCVYRLHPTLHFSL